MNLQARSEFLERTLWAIRDQIARAESDSLERTLRVINQRVDWALDGSAPPSVGAAILDQLGEERAGDLVLRPAPGVGFNLELSVDRACTIRLKISPDGDGVTDGERDSSRSAEETPDPFVPSDPRAGSG